ncbi:hypothetical protein [Enterobacter bugandensis]|uniref:hypothetical protein n=1 Tax=Enterobacter bugandensis TaxID=881260 RepID=UPI0021CEDBAB|nr:hypothetical protein [Enterobacter bugandensis]MCU6172428.1 hypothetical protein [Enterobacter bugandensis]
MFCITDDKYFRAGFESLIASRGGLQNASLCLMDDGARYLYFLDAVHGCSGLYPVMCGPIYYFVNHIRTILPRETSPERLIRIISDIHQGAYPVIRLTPAQMSVIMDVASKVKPGISQARSGMNMKTWNNFKYAGLRRLGIKNTLSLVRAADVWKRRGHKTVCGKEYSASASEEIF